MDVTKIIAVPNPKMKVPLIGRILKISDSADDLPMGFFLSRPAIDH
jgi:hypothetical protein